MDGWMNEWMDSLNHSLVFFDSLRQENKIFFLKSLVPKVLCLKLVAKLFVYQIYYTHCGESI